MAWWKNHYRDNDTGRFVSQKKWKATRKNKKNKTRYTIAKPSTPPPTPQRVNGGVISELPERIPPEFKRKKDFFYPDELDDFEPPEMEEEDLY